MIAELLAAGTGAFDVDTATRAYLESLQGPARAQSDAYFEGGYWLVLWGAVVSIMADALLLRFRLTAAFRSLAARWFRRPFAIASLTGVLYIFAGWVITLPWTLYTGFFRERQYGLLHQAFTGWFGEELTDLVLTLAVTAVLLPLIYLVIRRSPKAWWLWATGVVGVFLLIGAVLAPVYIAPLFNTYSEMEAGPLRSKIEAVAAKYDIPSGHIYVFDQSKQHKRISANVSGLGPTIRISLNDNLLNRTSDEEVLAVMGHEMGHYKLGHVWWIFGVLLLIFGTCFFLTSRIAPWMIRRWGERWGVRDLADPASLPVLGICMSAFLFLATPAQNALVRICESQADAFGLDAAREPDGFARVAMRLSEYRKIEPGPVEEFLFFDHPSGAARVRMSMEWKAKHVTNPQIEVPPKGYLDSE